MFSFGSKMAFKKQAETKEEVVSRSNLEYDYLFKILVIGDSGVGKSCLLLRFADDVFFAESYISTIGVDFKIRTLPVDGSVVKMQIWDTTGQERFRTITSSYYRGAHAVLICFALDDALSFDRVKGWFQESERYCPQSTVRVLVGTKADSKREVERSVAQELADSLGIRYCETSAKTGEGVDETFLTTARSVKEGVKSRQQQQTKVASAPAPAPAQPQSSRGSSLASLFGFMSKGKEKAASAPPPSLENNSDEESFSEEELESDMTSLASKAKSTSTTKNKSGSGKKKEKQEAKRTHHRTDVNVFRLDLSKLAEDGQVMTGDATYCIGCSAVHNCYSQIVTATPSAAEEVNASKTGSKAPSLVTELFASYSTETSSSSASSSSSSSAEAERKYWLCEFCGYYNKVDLAPEEMPTNEMVDYVVELAPISESEANPNVIFCIDISGSMCCTTEVAGKLNLKGAKGLSNDLRAQAARHGDQWMPGQRRDVTYVSRLQCVQAAVEHQIEQIVKEHPKTRVGLITFNDEVTLLGDGSQEPVVVAGDKLFSFTDLSALGESFIIQKSVEESKAKLLETLWGLSETGTTALGPALLLSIALAGSRPASKVILCTDGLANLGIGTLEGKTAEYSPVYVEMAERAKLKGVTVSVISLTGTDCALENLSIVTEQTAGVMEKVDPLQLTTNFGSILAVPIIATQAMATVILHRGLMFRNMVDDEEDRNFLIKDLGNVTAETECTFSYGFVPKSVFDLSGTSEIPFQVQLVYTKRNGMRCLRVVTTKVATTENRAEAEKNADIQVIGTYAAQRAGRYAKEGDYEKAQLEARSAQRFIARNAVEEGAVTKWSSAVENLDKELRTQKKKEKTPASKVERQKKRAEDDDVATAISRTTTTNTKSLFM